MEKKVTALDVARAAGVSQSTVSRVFSPQSNINSKKREYILEVARELGYHPNALARGLTMNRSYIIAMIGIGRDDVFYSSLLAGLIDGLQKNGLQMLVFNYYKPNQLDEIVEKLYQYNIDGILVTSSVISKTDIEKLEHIGKPIILINRMIPDCGARAVCCDNVDGTQKIINHLKDIGRTRVGLLSGPNSSYTANDRTEAFLKNMESSGMELCSSVRAEELTHLSGKLAMKKLLIGKNQFDAVFCTNDLLAIGAIDALHEEGICAPEQIAIAGFDGDISGMWSPYRLTTIKQPIDKLVEETVITLNKLLQGKDVPPCQWFQGELVIRNSTVREKKEELG